MYELSVISVAEGWISVEVNGQPYRAHRKDFDSVDTTPWWSVHLPAWARVWAGLISEDQVTAAIAEWCRTTEVEEFTDF